MCLGNGTERMYDMDLNDAEFGRLIYDQIEVTR